MSRCHPPPPWLHESVPFLKWIACEMARPRKKVKEAHQICRATKCIVSLQRATNTRTHIWPYDVRRSWNALPSLHFQSRHDSVCKKVIRRGAVSARCGEAKHFVVQRIRNAWASDSLLFFSHALYIHIQNGTDLKDQGNLMMDLFGSPCYHLGRTWPPLAVFHFSALHLNHGCVQNKVLHLHNERKPCLLLIIWTHWNRIKCSRKYYFV